MNPATDTATLVHQSLQRLASQSAACKLWSTALVTGVLAWMHSSRIGNDSMLWAASPVLVLLLADAAYATQAARLLAKLRQSKKPGVEDLLQAHAPLSGGHTLGGLAGLVSSSVWPFYFALACAFFIAGHEAARPALPPPSAPGSSSLNRLGSKVWQQRRARQLDVEGFDGLVDGLGSKGGMHGNNLGMGVYLTRPLHSWPGCVAGPRPCPGVRQCNRPKTASARQPPRGSAIRG